MTSIRKYAYATLLVAANLTFAPNLATAQTPAHGKFTLAHEVHFGAAKIPAGEYTFSFDPDGISPVLTLSKMSGARAGFMVLVPVVEDGKPSDASELLLESTPAGSYVSALHLPQCGMTLHFEVPSRPEKQLAKTVSTASAVQ